MTEPILSVDGIMKLVDTFGTAIENCMHTALHNAAPDTMPDEMIGEEDVSAEHKLEVEARTALESALRQLVEQRDAAVKDLAYIQSLLRDDTTGCSKAKRERDTLLAANARLRSVAGEVARDLWNEGHGSYAKRLDDCIVNESGG